MKFKDKDFTPYKFPYEHNYRNYAQFALSQNFEENDYYVYLISNPFQFNYKKTTNDYSISVGILVRNKKTKKVSTEIVNFDFKSILQLNIFGKIENKGDVSLFENYKEEFTKKIHETRINIPDTTECEILSLEDVVDRFGILKKANLYKEAHFKDLEYYLYTIDDRKILIPAMEVLKYFYLFNYTKQDEPKSSFCKDILTPNGIFNSLKSRAYCSIKNHYELEISGNYSISDIYKILFFITNKKRLDLYSNIESVYKKTNKISALIPRKDTELIARVFKYKNLNVELVLNIISHDFNYEKEFPQSSTCDYKHAKSLFKEEDVNKRDSSKDRKKKLKKNKNLEVNDELYGNSDFEYEEETHTDFKLNINNEKASESIDLNINRVIDDQRKQQGSKNKKDYSNISETPLTSKDNKGNSDEAVSINSEKNDEKDESNKNYLSLIEVLNRLKKNSNFEFKNIKTFKYPKVVDNKGEEIRRSIIFTDENKKIRRKYYIAELKYKSLKDIYLIELQPKTNGNQKSFLTIIKSAETLETINKKYISEELIDLATNGNRSWFSASVTLDESEYMLSNHRSKVSSFEDKLISKLDS